MRQYAASFLLCGLLALPASAQTADTLTGTVTDSATSAALSAVSVSSEGVVATTSGAGTFTLVLPLSSAVRPRAVAPGVEAVASGLRNAEGRAVDPALAPTALFEKTGRAYRIALSKASATGKAHDLSFSKAGYATKSLAVPAGNAAALQVKLAAEKSIESLEVGDGRNATSKTSLDSGELYLLKASGYVDCGAEKIDAEYGFGSGTGKDSVGGEDLGVDFGLKTVRIAKLVTVPPGRMHWFGSYRADHVYHVIVEGLGKPFTVKLLKGGSGAGTGSITVSFVKLSPKPPQVGTEIDTVWGHLTKDTVYSHLTTVKGTVYLLQCDGQGHVGGARLAMGDAENMDYDANGGGRLDVGDLNTDYGLGVDEIFPGKTANTLTPRKNWWGNFRKDHVYYQLFEGTGKPVAFEFYDSGYGDNAKDQFLMVRFFNTP